MTVAERLKQVFLTFKKMQGFTSLHMHEDHFFDESIIINEVQKVTQAAKPDGTANEDFKS